MSAAVVPFHGADGPAPDAIRMDAYGRPMTLYALSYDMGGREVCLHLWAYSFDDAETRVTAMRASLRVDGQILEKGDY